MSAFFFLASLVASALAIALVVGPKVPALAAGGPSSREEPPVLERMREWLRQNAAARALASRDILLQRALSRARVFLLRLEGSLARRLEALRRKAREQEEQFSKEYWMGVRAADPSGTENGTSNPERSDDAPDGKPGRKRGISRKPARRTASSRAPRKKTDLPL